MVLDHMVRSLLPISDTGGREFEFRLSRRHFFFSPKRFASSSPDDDDP